MWSTVKFGTVVTSWNKVRTAGVTEPAAPAELFTYRLEYPADMLFSALLKQSTLITRLIKKVVGLMNTMFFYFF